MKDTDPLWNQVGQELPSWPGFGLHAFAWVPSTGSTNDDLKGDWLAGKGLPCLLVAGHQIRGRGRLGRDWIDEPGRSLLFSFCWEWPVEILEQGVLNPALLAGLAVHRALHGLGAHDLILKWPNDVMSGRRKLAGVLVESAPLGDRLRAVIGVGVNVQPFATSTSSTLQGQPLQRTPISLFETGVRRPPPQVLKAILEAWATLSDRWKDPSLIDEARRAGGGFFGVPHTLRRPDGSILWGVPLDLAIPGGVLVFQTESGESLQVTGAHSLEPQES